MVYYTKNTKEERKKLMNDEILRIALKAAQQAYDCDEVPVGAVIFDSVTKNILYTTFNQTETLKDPTAHAELLAIQKACQILNEKRLNGYSMFVTLEPCAMCAGAIAWARLDSLYFGASDPKSGGVQQGACVFSHPQTHHKISVSGGYSADIFGQLLTSFFKSKRGK